MVVLVVLGLRLDLVILRVVSNPKERDSLCHSLVSYGEETRASREIQDVGLLLEALGWRCAVIEHERGGHGITSSCT